MRFVIDESVDRQVAERLRHEGHQVWYVPEIERAISDDLVLDLANKNEAMLVTADKDFGELVFRDGRVSLGVVLLRLHGFSPEHKADLATAAIRDNEQQLLNGFAVVSPGAVRIRPRLL